MGADYKHARSHPFLGGTASNLDVAGVAQYYPVCGIEAPSPTRLNMELIAEYAGIIFGLTSWLAAAPGGVATRTFTLYVNAAPTALTVTHVGASDYEVDDLNIVAVQRGDRIVWHSDGGAGGPAATRVKTSCQYRRI